MKPIEILLNIVSMSLAAFSAQMVVRYLYPKFKKEELEDEEKAKQLRYVRLNNKTVGVFIALIIFVDSIGIIIFACPNLITNVFRFPYIKAIVFWWIPLLFDNVVLYFMFTQAIYNDKEIHVKKVLSKPKVYKFSEIISFTEIGNLRVKTKKGSFMLFNAMAGTKTLREIIKTKVKDPFCDLS